MSCSRSFSSTRCHPFYIFKKVLPHLHAVRASSAGSRIRYLGGNIMLGSSAYSNLKPFLGVVHFPLPFYFYIHLFQFITRVGNLPVMALYVATADCQIDLGFYMSHTSDKGRLVGDTSLPSPIPMYPPRQGPQAVLTPLPPH